MSQLGFLRLLDIVKQGSRGRNGGFLPVEPKAFQRGDMEMLQQDPPAVIQIKGPVGLSRVERAGLQVGGNVACESLLSALRENQLTGAEVQELLLHLQPSLSS